MSDLIDKDAAIAALIKVALQFGITGEPQIMILAKNALRALPAADVAVKPEPDNRQYYPQPARDDLAFAMFAGWLNCAPDKVPLEFKAWTCPQTRAAWGRVADAARKHLTILTPAIDPAKVQALVQALVEAAGHARLALSGYVSRQSACDKLDAALAAFEKGGE